MRAATNIVIAIALAGCGSKERHAKAECLAPEQAKNELSGLVTSARGMARNALAAIERGDSVAADFCDRMVEYLGRTHGYMRGFDARWSADDPDSTWIEARFAQSSGSIDFAGIRNECLNPNGTTMTTRFGGKTEAPRAQRSYAVLTALFDELDRDIAASLDRKLATCRE